MGKMGLRDTGTDTYLYEEIEGGNSAAVGLDNSDSDKLKMVLAGAAGATPSGTAQWVMTQLGARTLPLQPTFFAQVNTENNASGDGTAHDIGSITATTEIVDRNADFFPGDGAGTPATFTAPVSGVYIFLFSLSFNIDVTGGDEMTVDIVLSSGVTMRVMNLPTRNKLANFFGNGSLISYSASAFASMTAGDTAVFRWTSTGGALADDITSSDSYLSGALFS